MSRIRSPLADGDHQLRRKDGWRRKDCPKRKLLRAPRQKREAIRQTSFKPSPLRESKGHRAEVGKYNASAAAFFAELGNDVCHICVKLREDGDNILLQPATERHHVRGRIGRLLNWRPGQIPSCRGHRSWPHDHPARARSLGLLCAPALWNVFPSSGNGAEK
jgi:hypothetical protein